jgi:hypothetical protein
MPGSSIFAYLRKILCLVALLEHKMRRTAEGAQKSLGVPSLFAQKTPRRRQSSDDEVNSFMREIRNHPIAPLFSDIGARRR